MINTVSDRVTIEKQKEVTNEIYKKLCLVDPTCILVGGAPRDWYFGNAAKDLDFYYKAANITILYKLFMEFKPVLKFLKNAAQVKPMTGVESVLEFSHKLIKIQLTQISYQCPVSAVDDISVSLSKIYYTPSKGIVSTSDFDLTVKSKIMFLSEGHQWSSEYCAKIINRFKDKGYNIGTREQAVNSINLKPKEVR